MRHGHIGRVNEKGHGMRVVGYARLSRASEESTSIAKQEEIITRAAESKGWDLVGIEVDEDASATKTRLDRPGLTEARRRIAEGEADALLCWRLDRVARSVVDMGTLLDEGLQIVSASEPLDTTTPMGRAMVEVLQVFAGLESATTGERSRATKAYLKSHGRWGGGPRPYGFEPLRASDGRGKVLRVVEEEAVVVRRIFEALDAGEGPYAVARALNADGVPTSTGRGGWEPSTVLNLARAWHVSGFLSEGVRVPDPHKPGKTITTRDRRPVLGADGEPVRAWVPLVPDDLAERVRARVTTEALDEARSAATKRGLAGETRRLLSGLAVCRCGERLLVKTRKGRAFYGCRGVRPGSHVLADAERVEGEAERQALALWGSFRVTDVVVEKTPIAAALSEVERDLAMLGAEIVRPGADVAALSARISALSEERARLEGSGDRVTRQTRSETYAEAWDQWSIDERREHLEVLGATVTVREAARRGAWDPTRVVLSGEHDYMRGADLD